MTRPLGRIRHHDPRNLLHLALVAPPPRAPKPYPAWWTRDVFDQGTESSCTAQAAIGMLRTNPHRRTFTEFADFDEPAERFALYRAAQQVDPWDGDVYDGTSTDAPFKVLRSQGSITAWKWLMGEQQVREWVTWFGPVVVGTIWLDGMFDTDAAGYLNLDGSAVGGHAYRIVQFSPSRDAYRVVNSWGRSWGQQGRAWLRRVDLDSLLAADGEAVVVG